MVLEVSVAQGVTKALVSLWTICIRLMLMMQLLSESIRWLALKIPQTDTGETGEPVNVIKQNNESKNQMNLAIYHRILVSSYKYAFLNPLIFLKAENET